MHEGMHAWWVGYVHGWQEGAFPLPTHAPCPPCTHPTHAHTEEAGTIVTKCLGLHLTRMMPSLAIRTGGMRAEPERIHERPKRVRKWRQRSAADTCG